MGLENIEDEKIDVLYLDSNIECYIYIFHIFYKHESDEDFKTLDIVDFEKLNVDKSKYLIPVAKELVNRSWGFAHYVLDFLIKFNDLEAINMVKRYAEGNFSSKELKNNKNSSYSRNDIQVCCKNLL